MNARVIPDVRWQEAQSYELREWTGNQALLESEWEELEHKFSHLFPRIAQAIGLQSSSTVLDVGSSFTVPARLLGTGTIVGLEPLADKLGITGREKDPPVTMVSARAEAMPFADGAFDLVVCRNVLDHTQDPRTVMREMHRVMKPGGFLLLICYTYAPFITTVKQISERLGLFRNVGHPHTFTPQSLERLAHPRFVITECFTIYAGQHSTDYGKVGALAPDRSLVHRTLTWINQHIMRSSWFLKEYGYLARKSS